MSIRTEWRLFLAAEADASPPSPPPTPPPEAVDGLGSSFSAALFDVRELKETVGETTFREG